MSYLIDFLNKRFYPANLHPYSLYENKILSILRDKDTVLDAGCGRSAEVLRKFIGKADALIGVDLEEQSEPLEGINYLKSSVENIDIANDTVDIVISRAVLEHIEYPEKVFREISRVLRKGGSLILLLPNYWDYASIISRIIPNNLHAKIVSIVEGRDMNDTFPAYYRVNTYPALYKLCNHTGFDIIDLSWISQNPNYFQFNSILYLYAVCYERIINRYNAFKSLRGWMLIHLRKCVN